ncbi:MAG TPA: magnesium-translocating P-type ATPase [Casimicrobiaceae bacterium]|nr:magnesium-translocating P-type ATPase [Casimicrobiaceae bacterium]
MIRGAKNWFSRFLRRRRRLKHFGRHPLVETLAARGPAKAIPEHLASDLMRVAREDASTALRQLRSHADGLTAAESAARLARHGPNEVTHEKPLPGWLHLWHCYNNPFNLLLTALAVVAYLTEDAKATIVIGSMVLLSTVIRFVQEGRSNRAAERLKAMVGNTATVLRRHSPHELTTASAKPSVPSADISQRMEIPLRKLVVGDVVALSAGDMVPADCRLLASRDLFLAQSAMTGESLPVEKFADRHTEGAGPLEQENLVFMGTNVVSGTATALVAATGNDTYFGTLATRVTAVDATPNAFQAGVNSVSWLLIRFAAVMVPIVLLINGFAKGDWLEAFLFALSVAVGLTPEMLPMIATTTFALGAVRLSRKQVIVKRLDAIQTFGAMDVLCTDKTGTLTEDRISLARHIDAFGDPSEEVLGFAFLNSHYQTGLKNLLDRAVLEHVELQTELKLEQDYRRIDEIPFDFVRRRMSVVVSERDHHHELICKGALEEVLAVCTRVRIGSAAAPLDAPLDAAVLSKVQRVTRELNLQGLRVVAVAMKELPTSQATYSVADEAGLTLIGYVAFLDPPKQSAAEALEALAGHGVAIKVLTGDNELVTAHVCGQVGLSDEPALLGPQVERMQDEELAEEVVRRQVFAKLSPLHKERIVRALRTSGHVVGFIGDGINDAPALRAADIGISVDSAVDIAKEAADIILLEKSLMVLDLGVVEGRTTFSNMLKYIRMTASSNFGNVLSVLVASAFLPFLPMLPLQLLLQNLLYDISQTGIPFDNVDAELVGKPLKWDPGGIGRFMFFFGPISSLFDLVTFGAMWWVFDAKTVALQSLFQSGWFVEGLLTQTLIVHMIRTRRVPFIQSRAAAPLMASTLAIMVVGTWLPMGPLAGYFRFVPLPAAYFAWLAGILLCYCALTTFMKRYVRWQ